MIELTPDQCHALQGEGSPARARNPETNTTYVLVPNDVYDRLKALLVEDDDPFVRDMYPQVMEVFGREGWDDPAMDVYNDLDPRRRA